MHMLHADMYHRPWSPAAVAADIRQSGFSAGPPGKYGQRQNRKLTASIRDFSGLNEQTEQQPRFLLKPSGISSAQIQKETFPGAAHIPAGSETGFYRTGAGRADRRRARELFCGWNFDART